MRIRLRIRTIFLVVNVIILLLPLASIAFLRIYDNELVRQTEASLMGQGVVLQSTYLRVLFGELNLAQRASYGLEREIEQPDPENIELGRFPPSLDVMRDEIYPPTLAAEEYKGEPDDKASNAGAKIFEVLRDANGMLGTSISVVNFKGQVVGATGLSMLGKSINHRPEVKRALKGEVVRIMQERESDQVRTVWDSISGRGRVLVVVAVPVVWQRRVYGAVVLSRPPLSLGDAIVRNRAVFAGLLAVLIIAVSLITLLTTVTIQRPLRQLNRQTRRIATSAASAQPIENPGAVEFEELSKAIAHMARTLEDRNEYIRSFARNVSHEFKTPLASIKGSVELLEDHFETMKPEKRAEFLGIIARDTERLDRLVRRLLELARADVFNPTTEWVNGADQLEGLARRSKVKLTFTTPIDDLPVAMSPDAFESVFTNLFDNAAKHGSANVALEVLERTPSYFRILVSDDGPGISEANRSKVFESFFTTAREGGGTGLGLPIVRSMLQRHGGDITISPSESGAAFVVTLPRST